MHITHVNLSNNFRGGERQTVLLINALKKYNIKQSLIYRHSTPLYKFIDKSCESIPIQKPFSLTGLRGIHGSLLHAHEGKASQIAYINYLRKKTPYLITRRIQRTPSNHFFTRAIYENAGANIPISNSIFNSLKNYSQKVLVKPPIHDAYANFEPNEKTIQAMKNRFSGKFIVGHIGALNLSEKGQQHIITAAKAIEHTHPNIMFILAGDGPDRAELLRATYKMQNIELLGFTDDVGSLIGALDLFIFPSAQEGFGSTLLDVMHGQVPIIASNIKGINEIIRHEYNGILIESINGEKLAQNILQLYNNPLLRDKFILNSQKDLSQFSAASMAEKYFNIYQEFFEIA